MDCINKELFVFDELYEKALTNEMIYKRILNMKFAKEKIKADSAEPKSIEELRQLGLCNIRAARKGKDSVLNGIQYIQGFKIIIHPKCVNFITEINNYTWEKNNFGKLINQPIDSFNHLLDAMRYALEDFIKGDTFSFD